MHTYGQVNTSYASITSTRSLRATVSMSRYDLLLKKYKCIMMTQSVLGHIILQCFTSFIHSSTNEFKRPVAPGHDLFLTLIFF